MRDWNEITSLILPCFAGLGILAAMELDIFTALEGEGKTAEQVAIERDLSPRHVSMLLRSLAATGVIILEGSTYHNSVAADTYLVKGKPQYRGGSHALFSHMVKSVSNTATTLRFRKPKAYQDWNVMTAEQLRPLLGGLNVGARMHGKALAKLYDFSRFKNVLDVGGGGGGLAIGICELCADVMGFVVDLPKVAEVGRELVFDSEPDLKIQFIEHDVTTSPLDNNFDAAVLRNLVQVLDPQSALRAIENVGQSLTAGGEIFIIGAVLDDDGLGPKGALAGNLFFLNVFEAGEAYTESQYREWLNAAGFTGIERTSFGEGLDLSLLRGIKGTSPNQQAAI